MLFPFNSYFDPEINKLITSRAGDNLGVSKLMPWMRVSSSSGLVIETLPNSDSFEARYGSTEKSGRVGTDFGGNSVFVTPDRGFRPSPVIDSLGVSFGEGGLTRKSSFNIKCFTLKQAEKVAEYFLEPGYTVLVEYGWNLSKSYAEKISLDTCGIARFNTYTHVKEKQKRSGFTYDGFLGYITGGGFNTGADETYILSVELTSIGEVAAYLQQHRSGGKIDDTQNSGGERFDTRAIESTAETNVGLALFMQMYNRLPPTKRNDDVKKLIKEKDSREILFISEANFINMDDEIRKDLVNDLQDTAVNQQQNEEGGSENSGEASVPDGPPLVSESSYIRLELAFEILNRLSYDTKPIPKVCEDVPSFPLAIEYRNTICRGHQYMFSTDGSKLIIPNRNTPDFGLAKALSATTIQEIGPIIDSGGRLQGAVNLEQKDPQGNVFRFPEISALPDSEFPIDAAPFSALIGQWGYLKDLYVNFEFFIEVLSKPNYVAKDIYYEILNGISSAANAIWHFDIVQIPSRREENKGNYQLEIVDLNFTGKVGTDRISKFFSSGVNSPFLESSFGFDIPAAMKNMIIAERTAGSKVDSAPEGNLPNATLFAKKPDPVVDKLINFQKSLVEQDSDVQVPETSTTTADTESEKEARKQNYELFMKFATIIPTIKNRTVNRDVAKGVFDNFFNGVGDILAAITGFFGFGTATTTTDPTLEQIVAVGAWSDTSLFRRLDLNVKNETTPNNLLQQITFDFKIHGVSGIKTGDLFEIQDLPSQFKDRAAFTVVEISHSLDGTLWTTSVTGKMKLK